MEYALGLDLDGPSVAVAVSRADRTGREERDVVQRATAVLSPSRLLERVGDPVPLHDGGAPIHAHAGLAALVAHAVASATEREGLPPDRVLVGHPATWGPYRISLLLEALGREGVARVALIPDAVAAAIHAAHERPVADERARVVAVLDFREDHVQVAVVSTDLADDSSATVLGRPRRIDHFGAADADDAVLAHVRSVLGTDLTSTDPADRANPVARAMADRLRAACAAARAALLTQASATVSWELAEGSREVRIVRAELDDRIRDRCSRAVNAASEAVAASAPAGVDRVLLLGEAAAMPLVMQCVAVEFDAPIVVIDDSAHAVARGAARAARMPAPVVVPGARPVAKGSAAPRAAARHARHRPVRTRTPATPGRVRAAAMAATGVMALAITVTALAVSGAASAPTETRPEGRAPAGSTAFGTRPLGAGIVLVDANRGALLAPGRPAFGPSKGAAAFRADARPTTPTAPAK